ncbi:MAG: hypothetical protein WB562_21045 [Candidatus Sulfotelmatobacter sp.]
MDSKFRSDQKTQIVGTKSLESVTWRNGLPQNLDCELVAGKILQINGLGTDAFLLRSSESVDGFRQICARLTEIFDGEGVARKILWTNELARCYSVVKELLLQLLQCAARLQVKGIRAAGQQDFHRGEHAVIARLLVRAARLKECPSQDHSTTCRRRVGLTLFCSGS